MNLRAKISLLAVFSAALLLLSCGGGSLGGGVGEFMTVFVSAQASTPRLESNVINGNTCSDTGSTGGSFATDNITATVTSTVFPGLTGQSSPIFIDSYTVSFTPVDSVSPALSPINASLIGTTVPAGGSASIAVAVAPDTLKLSLVNDKNLQPCSTTVYQYFATITFHALELFTNKRSDITTSLTVAFADRVN
jgi:hypothetical protein